MVTEPASERGQIILMKGRRPVGVHARGVPAGTNFAGPALDWASGKWRFGAGLILLGITTPKIVSTEKIGNESYHVLELIAVDRSVTYQRVVYWVNEKSGWPFKAEFYSLSNRLMKKCSYEKFPDLGGAGASDTTGNGGCFAQWREVGAGLQRDEVTRFAGQDIYQGVSEEAGLV